MQIEVAIHELFRIALEVAPFIMVREARGRDPRPRGQRPQSLPLRFAERPIDCLKFIVLIFAHGAVGIVQMSKDTALAGDQTSSFATSASLRMRFGVDKVQRG